MTKLQRHQLAGGVGVESIVAGTNITVDDADPANPIISAAGGGGGSGTLAGLTDVDVAARGDGQGLTFDESSGLWVASDIAQSVEFSPGDTGAATVARDSTSGGTYQSQTWTVTTATRVELVSLQTDIFAADTYTLTINGISVATVAATAGQLGVTFAPPSALMLDAGAHTFKITSTAAQRRYFHNNATPPTRTGSASPYVSAWGTWAETSTQYVAATLNLRVYSLAPSKPPVVLIESGGLVPSGSKVGAVVFEKGVGLVGWWDGSAVQTF